MANMSTNTQTPDSEEPLMMTWLDCTVAGCISLIIWKCNPMRQKGCVSRSCQMVLPVVRGCCLFYIYSLQAKAEITMTSGLFLKLKLIEHYEQNNWHGTFKMMLYWELCSLDMDSHTNKIKHFIKLHLSLFSLQCKGLYVFDIELDEFILTFLLHNLIYRILY